MNITVKPKTKVLRGDNSASIIKDAARREAVRLHAFYQIIPCLAIIQIGDNPASNIYVKGKQKDCEYCHIQNTTIRLPESVSQERLIDEIRHLANDDTIHGIIVQLPLPAHINEEEVIKEIPPEKDVDGFNPINMGNLVLKNKCLAPCTPAGCIAIMKENGIKISGKHVVIVGRSNIVGKPLALMLLNEDATVTITHSKTENLEAITRTADIVVVAIGKANFIKSSMLKSGAVVIDVGINRDENGKIHGDVDFVDVFDKVDAITPVPGGIGLMTRAILMSNTVKAAEYRLTNDELKRINQMVTSNDDEND